MRSAQGSQLENIQPDHLLHYGLYPCLEYRVFRCISIDCNRRHVSLSQVCLMEHERIVVEAQEMASVGCLFQSKERIEVTRARSGCDPFGHCTGWQIALNTLVQADKQ
jgi:hypothetical protein